MLTSNGKGAVSDREDAVISMAADAELRRKADVVVAIGTRFLDNSSQPRSLDTAQKLIRIDIDQEEIERSGTPDVGIAGDARAVLAALYDLVADHMPKRASRASEHRALKQAMAARIDAIQPQAGFAHALRAALPDDGIVVSEMTQLGYWSHLGFPVYQPNTYLTPGYQGTLGYGFTTAMGAKVGKPDVPVVSVNGDGGFGFTLNELATMAQHNIAVVAVVFNDSAYGNVRRIQQDDLGGKLIASDLVNPDYVKLADAFGIAGYRVDTPEAFGQALDDALSSDAPALIEVPVGPMPNPWKLLGFALRHLAQRRGSCPVPTDGPQAATTLHAPTLGLDTAVVDPRIDAREQGTAATRIVPGGLEGPHSICDLRPAKLTKSPLPESPSLRHR